ncbi:hypothetical protein [Alteromonas sp. IB21]|uniref:hypothetical protein n=1 Tax=Alteromonas sp. IB21 TaxID=2779369 RepID=UPI001E541F82|nr:hypothetical protein [Alteromonas sp. IB21]
MKLQSERSVGLATLSPTRPLVLSGALETLTQSDCRPVSLCCFVPEDAYVLGQLIKAKRTAMGMVKRESS